MELGKFVDSRIIIPINFCLDGSTNLEINFVLDTGFSDFLTLPPEAVTVMNLPLRTHVLATMADGHISTIPLHLARIRWNNNEKLVTVLATGTQPLIGRALLQGYRLTAEFILDGIVKVEEID